MSRVLMVGPSKKMKGGITTVINGYRENEKFNSENKVRYYSSCINGTKLLKLIYMSFKLVLFPFVLLFFRPHIIHIHSAFGTSFKRKALYIRFSALFKIKIINHIHGAEWDDFYINSSYKRRKYIDKIYNKCNVIIVLSEEWKNKLSNIVPLEKIFVVKNFVSIRNKDIFKSEKTNTITFIGEFCDRKGCFNIPKIYEEMPELRRNYNFKFGGFGDNQKLNDLINKYSNFYNVGFLDYNNKVKLLSETKVFLFPTKNEGVPMVLLEAMSFGIPCITTNVGGIPSIINDSIGNGILFDPNDYTGMANELTKLLSDIDYYQKISVNCMNLAKKYSFEENMSAIINIYDRLK